MSEQTLLFSAAKGAGDDPARAACAIAVVHSMQLPVGRRGSGAQLADFLAARFSAAFF